VFLKDRFFGYFPCLYEPLPNGIAFYHDALYRDEILLHQMPDRYRGFPDEQRKTVRWILLNRESLSRSIDVHVTA